MLFLYKKSKNYKGKCKCCPSIVLCAPKLCSIHIQQLIYFLKNRSIVDLHVVLYFAVQQGDLVMYMYIFLKFFFAL